MHLPEVADNASRPADARRRLYSHLSLSIAGGRPKVLYFGAKVPFNCQRNQMLSGKNISGENGFPKGWGTQNRSSERGLDLQLSELREMQAHC